jgi:hypothetical protein
MYIYITIPKEKERRLLSLYPFFVNISCRFDSVDKVRNEKYDFEGFQRGAKVKKYEKAHIPEDV